MLSLQSKIVLIHHTFTCDIKKDQRQRRFRLILEHELENKRLLHFLLLRGGQQIAALEQRLLIHRAEFAADLRIQRHAGRVEMIGRRILQRMDQCSHVHGFSYLGSADDRNDVARHFSCRHRQLIMAMRAQSATGHLAITVIQSDQDMIRINQMLWRNIMRTQHSLHIIDDIQAEPLAVSVKHFILAERIIFIVITIMGRPKDDLTWRELTEAIGADYIVK
ncbi:hypothetical protein D3C77_270490 [compost metagenome]